MGWRGVLKGIFVTSLLGASIVAFYFGSVYLLFGRPLQRLLGIVLLFAMFRGVVLAFDLMWGRPPGFSKRPWERPWEEEKRPPGW